MAERSEDVRAAEIMPFGTSGGSVELWLDRQVDSCFRIRARTARADVTAVPHIVGIALALSADLFGLT